jgi:hypothetical protein
MLPCHGLKGMPASAAAALWSISANSVTPCAANAALSRETVASKSWLLCIVTTMEGNSAEVSVRAVIVCAIQ